MLRTLVYFASLLLLWCGLPLYLSRLGNLLSDARREARKAFLAFSSDDAKAHHTETEPSEDYLGNLEQSVNDAVQTSQSTPVRTFLFNSIILFPVPSINQFCISKNFLPIKDSNVPSLRQGPFGMLLF